MLLKLEMLQPSGAFKLRGAANAVLARMEEGPCEGFVTASTGNHGRALAYAARAVGKRAVVCLSDLVPQNKCDTLERIGAELDIGGASQDVATVRAMERAQDEGLFYVSPYDDSYVIAGQGTAALEIMLERPDVETIVVPLSGGGLAAGTALAAKTIKPSISIIAVSSDRGPAMLASLMAGEPVEIEEEPSLADSLGGGIGLNNRWSFDLVRQYVDEVRIFSDEEIAEAMRYLYESEKLMAEGGAAIGICAFQAADAEMPDGPVVMLLTGNAVDPAQFRAIIAGEWEPTARPASRATFPRRYFVGSSSDQSRS